MAAYALFPCQAGNTISVWNNGQGIPVEMHAVEGVYVPELIFGHLLTSSNYDDNEKKARFLGYNAKAPGPKAPCPLTLGLEALQELVLVGITVYRCML